MEILDIDTLAVEKGLMYDEDGVTDVYLVTMNSTDEQVYSFTIKYDLANTLADFIANTK